jgi:hypothetical protein
MTPRCITRQRSGYGSVGSGWAARGKGRRGWPMASGGRREAVLPGPWVRGAWRRGIGRVDVGARAGGTDGRRGASASGPRASHGGRARRSVPASCGTSSKAPGVRTFRTDLL